MPEDMPEGLAEGTEELEEAEALENTEDSEDAAFDDVAEAARGLAP